MPRCLPAIHPWKADVHQDYVGLQLNGFLNGLKSVDSCGNDFEIHLRFKQLLNEILPRQKIIYSGHYLL